MRRWELGKRSQVRRSERLDRHSRGLSGLARLDGKPTIDIFAETRCRGGRLAFESATISLCHSETAPHIDKHHRYRCGLAHDKCVLGLTVAIAQRCFKTH
jgi:hypothetical protein